MTVVSQSAIIESLNPASAYTNGIEYVEGNEGLGKDAFLKLLITQMQNQDPLNPLEGIEFTSQLAQFTSLEQLNNIYDGISLVNTALNAQNNFQAIGLVGKEVKVLGDSFGVSDGQCSSSIFSIDEAASSVRVNIYNDSGVLVRSLDMGSYAEGEHTVTWDGLDSSGQKVEDGEYEYEILATGPDDETIEVSSLIQGTVTGISFAENQVTLLVNGLEVDILDLVSIMPASIGGDGEGDGSEGSDDSASSDNTDGADGSDG